MMYASPNPDDDDLDLTCYICGATYLSYCWNEDVREFCRGCENDICKECAIDRTQKNRSVRVWCKLCQVGRMITNDDGTRHRIIQGGGRGFSEEMDTDA
jgi:hypothetical protein